MRVEPGAKEPMDESRLPDDAISDAVGFV